MPKIPNHVFNKVKVLVVGKKVGESSAYEIAGVVSSEMGCQCQADVEVKSISDNELKAILSLLEGWKGNKIDPAFVNSKNVESLIKKLTPSPIES
jgi:hypothetical protein